MAKRRQPLGIDSILRTVAAAGGYSSIDPPGIEEQPGELTDRERNLRSLARWIVREGLLEHTLERLEQRLADEHGKQVHEVCVPVDLSLSPIQQARLYLNRSEGLYLELLEEQRDKALRKGPRTRIENRSDREKDKADRRRERNDWLREQASAKWGRRSKATVSQLAAELERLLPDGFDPVHARRIEQLIRDLKPAK